MNLADIIGSVGVGCILIAYLCNLFGFITKDGHLFFWLNIMGSALACYASLLIHYRPFVILEGTWLLVSITGLVKFIKAGKKK